MTGDESIIAGVAGRYATALFELAKEEKALDSAAADLTLLTQLIDTSEDLRQLLRSPLFSRDEQARALAAVMERAGIGGLTANFVGLVCQKRRLFALREMIGAFKTLLARHRGEITAKVTSARPLSEPQLDKLKDALKAVVGRTVQVDTSVDESLLGGLVVRVGSRMIDTTLRTKLVNLHHAMKEVG